MNKNNFLLKICFVVVMLSVNSVCGDAQEKTNDMEKFNIDFFNKSPKDAFSNYEYEEGDTIIILQEFSDSYKIMKQRKKSPYKTFKYFYKHNLSLRLKGQYYINSSVGIWEYYDENGNLIKTVDEDADFPFSFDDLAHLMKSEFEVDITEPKNLDIKVDRNTKPFPSYTVTDFPKSTRYEVDAQNGELIYIENIITGEVKKYSNPPKGKKDLSMNTSPSKGFWSTLFD